MVAGTVTSIFSDEIIWLMAAESSASLWEKKRLKHLSPSSREELTY